MRMVTVSVFLPVAVLALVALGSGEALGQSLQILQSATNPFNGSSYILFEPDDWTVSQDESVLYGGNLVTVNDLAENDWIKATFPVVDTWIGLNDIAVETVYEWISGQPSTFTDWAAGEPNSSGDYIYFWVAGSPSRAWDDTTNGGSGDNYGLCEIDPCGVAPPTNVTGTTVGADLELSFTNNGPYAGGIDVYRDGFYLSTIADPSAVSFLDTSVPCAGVYQYTLRASDGASCTAFADSQTVVHGVCSPPTGLSATDVGGAVELTWDNGGTVYTSIEILRGGAVIDTLAGSPSSYTDVPPSGLHQYEIRASDLAAIPCCVATSAPAGIIYELTDVIWRGETGGLVQSADELEQTLISLGRETAVVDDLLGCGCLAGAAVEVNLWVCLGTWPAYHCLIPEEGDMLVDRLAAGGNIFIEGGDIWGYCPTTSFRDVDGVDGLQADGNVIVDGDDSFVAMVGTAHDALDLTGMDATYTQDQAGNDYTDQLVPTGAGAPYLPDLPGTNAGAIWLNDTTGGATAYATGIFYIGEPPYGRVIAQSWEFGGYDGDREVLAQLYMNAFNGSTDPVFRRGDANDDSGFDISDAVFVLGALFIPGSPPATCVDSADSNDDGGVDISDAVYSLGALFIPGSPPTPDPGSAACGVDPTADSIGCDLYTSCP